MSEVIDLDSDESESCPPGGVFDQPLEATRTKFNDVGTFVYGWPTTGGVWIHDRCSGIELEFLNLSRFELTPTQRWSPEEDEFCRRLERIGAHFLKDEKEFTSTLEIPWVSSLWYGWPSSGGVWALRLDDELKGARLGVGRIKNALTMDERCRAIEMLGGEFYERWEDVPKNDA